MTRMTARDFAPELLELYDYYAHGKISKREFLDRAGRYAVGGVTALALLNMLKPDYALAQQVVVQPQATVVQPQVRTVQPTRSYRSYSVSPAQPQRADRRSPAHAGEATWRHADSKAAGHYTSGR